MTGVVDDVFSSVCRAIDWNNLPRVLRPAAFLDGNGFGIEAVGPFKTYYNQHRTHAALNGTTPIETTGSTGLDLKSYRWQTRCRGLYQTPIAA